MAEPFIPTTAAVRHAWAEKYAREVEYHEEGFAEFDRWLERLQTDAYFRGAESMSEQIFEDFNLPNFPHFISPFEDGDVDWHEWKRRYGMGHEA